MLVYICVFVCKCVSVCESVCEMYMHLYVCPLICMDTHMNLWRPEENTRHSVFLLSNLSLEGVFHSEPGAMLTAVSPRHPPMCDSHRISFAQLFTWVLEILNGDPHACVASTLSH